MMIGPILNLDEESQELLMHFLTNILEKDQYHENDK